MPFTACIKNIGSNSWRKPLVAIWLLAIISYATFPASAQTSGDHKKALARIASADPVLATALELIRIPSPSGKEEQIARHILRKLREAGANARRDKYGNVVARIPASPGYEKVPSLLLGAHMDMVPADKKNPTKAVRPRVKTLNGAEWIATDGTTTLGADDKAGVAVILDVVRRLTGKHPAQSTPLKHGPIEVALTREEETTVQGAKELQTTEFHSRYALLLDGTDLFEVVWELAGATEVMVRAHGGRGGHSGVDIHKPDNVNAIKVISEIDVRIPQGVVKRNERGVVTSINAGLLEGGQAKNAIAPAAQITYLVRTTDTGAEKKLLAQIRTITREVEQKYRQLQENFRIEMKVTPVLPPWAANTSSPLVKLLQETGQRLGSPKISPLSIHAGAEANIYANKKNSRGEILQPLLLGVANLHAIHTTRERMDWRSLIKGRDWIVDTIRLLAEKGTL